MISAGYKVGICASLAPPAALFNIPTRFCSFLLTFLCYNVRFSWTPFLAAAGI